jgi:predicted O-linked N-acetylglucosamine transferase (SPINDLY family)
MPGKTLVSRMGNSIVSALPSAGLISHSHADYIQKVKFVSEGYEVFESNGIQSKKSKSDIVSVIEKYSKNKDHA